MVEIHGGNEGHEATEDGCFVMGHFLQMLKGIGSTNLHDMSSKSTQNAFEPSTRNFRSKLINGTKSDAPQK